MAVQRMDHEVQQLLDLGLEAERFLAGAAAAAPDVVVPPPSSVFVSSFIALSRSECHCRKMELLRRPFRAAYNSRHVDAPRLRAPIINDPIEASGQGVTMRPFGRKAATAAALAASLLLLAAIPGCGEDVTPAPDDGQYGSVLNAEEFKNSAQALPVEALTEPRRRPSSCRSRRPCKIRRPCRCRGRRSRWDRPARAKPRPSPTASVRTRPRAPPMAPPTGMPRSPATR